MRFRVEIQRLDGSWQTVSKHAALKQGQFDAERWGTLYPNLPVRLKGKIGTGVMTETYTKNEKGEYIG